MKEKNSNLVVILTALIGMVLMSGVRAEGPEPKVARMQVFDNFVGWEEVAHFQSVNLRISGPDGMYFERTFSQEDSIYFDLTATPVSDGTYHWELRASPLLSDEVKDWLAYARETGDEEVVKELRRSGQLPSRALVDTGAFRVVDGILVNPDIPEMEEEMASPVYSFQSPLGLSPLEEVTSGNLIVPGRACLGSRCESGESFGDLGYQTLKLKQWRLRIKFEDTSASSGVPTNDWQITINDPDAGGAEYFAITDLDADSGSGTVPLKIDAGAPTSSLHVDDTGRIGLGTSTPLKNIHIVEGNTPTLRLEQDDSGGRGAYTWDVAGNESNFFVRDVSGGTDALYPFTIFPDSPSDSLTIGATTGDIGMGTLNPDSPLNIQTGGNMVTPQPDTVLHLENDEQDGFGTDLTITSAADKRSRIHFAKPGDPDAGGLYYSNTTDNFTFVADGKARMQLGPGAGSEPEVYFYGDVSITGSLSKGGGGFKIDHPLEPDKKFLSHSFVESPDMKNVYDGNVELDDKGEAWIQMPDYFEALNREFRYQLTPIGGAAPSLHVAEKISDNQFKIAGGPAGVEVSWQVTGVRKDTWAQANRIQVEEAKSRN